MYKSVKTKPNVPYAMIVDGMTLAYLFKSSLTNDLVNVATKCEAVLCCRMSPSQKANIVKMIKHSNGSPMTAAIGDDANNCLRVKILAEK